MSKKQKSFVKGAALLGAIGLVCKVIGAFYRIPMTNIITTNGVAFYQTAYTVYVFLLAVSSAGIPVAISKMVSERVTLGDYKAAHRVFMTALKALTLIGIITSVLMFALSGLVSNMLSRPGAIYSFMALAPSLFFVSVLSAYRGYFQGLNMMAPTAISQLIEQAGKLLIGLGAAWLWVKRGVEYGAAGAMLGVTVSEILALVFLIVLYNKKRPQIKRGMRTSVRSGLDDRQKISTQLLRIALPIIVGACAMPLVQLADTVIVTRSLLNLGYTTLQTDALYGNLTGVVNPLINMPAVLSLALAMSLVPAISAARARKNQAAVMQTSGFGFKLAMLVGLPCAVGFFILARPVISLLYSSLKPEELATSTVLLQIMSVAVLFLTVVQTMTGVLQGLNRPGAPVINLFIGVAVKVVVSLILIRIPEINIKGAAIGTAACYTVAATLDVACTIKYARMKLDPLNNFVKPILAAAGMGAFVYFLYPALAGFLPGKIATLAAILFGVIFYVAAILIIGAIRQEEIEFIPGGSHVERLMVKIGLWEKGR